MDIPKFFCALKYYKSHSPQNSIFSGVEPRTSTIYLSVLLQKFLARTLFVIAYFAVRQPAVIFDIDLCRLLRSLEDPSEKTMQEGAQILCQRKGILDHDYTIISFDCVYSVWTIE